jgi:hypothetical protein
MQLSGGNMPKHKAPYYVPIATQRNKLLMKEIVPGIAVLIDVLNSEIPYDHSLARAWIDNDQPSNGAAIVWFKNTGTGERLKFGNVDEVRAMMERSETVG